MEGRSGYWVVGGTEILLKNKFTYLYILHPDKSLPVTVNVEFINTSAQKVRSQKFQLKERRGIRIELPEQMSEECLVSPKPTRFCSLRLKTVPDWQLENFEMGVFVADPEAKLSPTSK
jgi:hypothetical protein